MMKMNKKILWYISDIVMFPLFLITVICFFIIQLWVILDDGRENLINELTENESI